MLCRIFLKLAGMSVTAGVLVLAILAVRALTRRRMPKWAHCLLWGLVAACLLCPVLPESGLSLRPQSGELVQYGDQLTSLDREPVIVLMETGAQDVYAFRTDEADRPGMSLMPLAYVWLAGTAVLLGWAAFSWLRLRRQVAASVNVAKGVYICDDIASPFILGVLHPRIYLPSGLTGATLESVLRHERAHLKRRDHWWKPLAHVLIAVYWFNPLLWAAYVLLCRDIELACDERVVRDMTREDRAAYSQALLQCSLNRRRRLVLCPLAFGEVGVRTRVKSVLRYRRPAVWLSAAAVLLCAALAVTFLTEPKTAENAPAEKARTHNNSYVDYFQRIQKKEAQQGRSVDNPVVIISTSMEPATGQISYQVQLLDGMTDWEKERILSRYNMNIANMEIFYPQEGDIYQEMDVPHLRFRAVSSTFAPPIDPAYDDLVALDNPYEPYTLASVTVLSADGSQSSTFRRVGQSLLLDDAPDDSGRNAISWSIRID